MLSASAGIDFLFFLLYNLRLVEISTIFIENLINLIQIFFLWGNYVFSGMVNICCNGDGVLGRS